MTTLRKQIQQAIGRSGRDRKSIAIEAGLDPVTLHRMAHAQAGASLEAIERVAAVLGYRVELVSNGRPALKAAKSSARKG
jgi:hypothetical protein